MSWSRLSFKIANYLMIIMFLISIGVQYNDPDPIIWMLIYAYALLVTFLAYHERYTVLAPIGAIAYFAAAIWWWPRDMQKPFMEIETARESGGLIFCGLWMLVIAIAWLKNRRRQSSIPSPLPGPAEPQ